MRRDDSQILILEFDDGTRLHVRSHRYGWLAILAGITSGEAQKSCYVTGSLRCMA
jgi:hypothetical protein